MQREKKGTTANTETTSMKVVEVKNDQFRIEREIEKNLKKIRSLISKLRPSERQKYFNGLLSHILSEPNADVNRKNTTPIREQNSDRDYSHLSIVELSLIQELSEKVEELYRTMDYDPS